MVLKDVVRKRLGLASDELMTDEEWAIFEQTVLQESIPLGAEIFREFIAELEADGEDVDNHMKNYLEYISKWSLVLENDNSSTLERLSQWLFGASARPRQLNSTSHCFKDSAGLEAAAEELAKLRKTRTWVRRENPKATKVEE